MIISIGQACARFNALFRLSIEKMGQEINHTHGANAEQVDKGNYNNCGVVATLVRRI